MKLHQIQQWVVSDSHRLFPEAPVSEVNATSPIISSGQLISWDILIAIPLPATGILYCFKLTTWVGFDNSKGFHSACQIKQEEEQICPISLFTTVQLKEDIPIQTTHAFHWYILMRITQPLYVVFFKNHSVRRIFTFKLFTRGQSHPPH